jgi:uncharacterized linocin/CFP29 family protein
MELKYFVIVLSVACILLLYFLSTLSQPIRIDLNEIPDYEGKQVIVEGVVTEHRITTYGGQIIEIKNLDSKNSSKTIVFVEGETNVEYGDIIQATGTVQKYKGEWEIVVNNERFVKILQKWSNITFPLWQLAEDPNKYVDTNVNVTGIIDRKYDAYFYLVDSEEQYTIAVYYDSSRFYTFSQGDTVYVGARFVYDAETMRFVLSAKEETHSISVIEEE